MATILAFEGKTPEIADDVFVAPTATLIGDVVAGPRASIWFGAVLRGDFDRIEVGEGTSVQDNTVIHAVEGLPTIVGRNVIVGHGSLLEGCVVEDSARHRHGLRRPPARPDRRRGRWSPPGAS